MLKMTRWILLNIYEARPKYLVLGLYTDLQLSAVLVSRYYMQNFITAICKPPLSLRLFSRLFTFESCKFHQKTLNI